MNKVFFLVAIVSVVVADSGNYQSGNNDPYKVNRNNPAYNMQNAYSNSRYNEPYESFAPQPYEFGYEVKDGVMADFGHHESGDGKGSVSGSYHVMLPDGRNQRVTYKDEGNGFVADVQYEGMAQFPTKNMQNGYSNHNNGENLYSGSIYRSDPSSDSNYNRGRPYTPSEY